MKIILPNGNVEETQETLKAIRNSEYHVLAQYVKRLYA